jgi:thiol-disulfide isomerase/thioredoxin
MKSSVSTVVQVAFISLAAVAVYTFVTAAREGEARRLCAPVCALSPDYAGRNRIAPDFELPALDGRTVRLSDYRGKVVVLNFWTKTCAPCLREMPSLNQLARVLEGHPNVELVTVTTDESAADAAATLQSVLNEAPVFVTLVDSESRIVGETYGTSLYPETWFIDPEGVIRARVDGPRDWHSLASLTVDLTRTLSGPLDCDVEFIDRRPTGTQCDDIPEAG